MGRSKEEFILTEGRRGQFSGLKGQRKESFKNRRRVERVSRNKRRIEKEFQGKLRV
jgi:hypothetical protein